MKATLINILKVAIAAGICALLASTLHASEALEVADQQYQSRVAGVVSVADAYREQLDYIAYAPDSVINAECTTNQDCKDALKTNQYHLRKALQMLDSVR